MRKEFMRFDARSKEAFNTAQLAALLARKGEFLSPVKTDAHGPDVIGYTPKTCTSRNIQVKSRITILEKYEGKDLYIAFPNWLDDVSCKDFGGASTKIGRVRLYQKLCRRLWLHIVWV